MCKPLVYTCKLADYTQAKNMQMRYKVFFHKVSILEMHRQCPFGNVQVDLYAHMTPDNSQYLQ